MNRSVLNFYFESVPLNCAKEENMYIRKKVEGYIYRHVFLVLVMAQNEASVG